MQGATKQVSDAYQTVKKTTKDGLQYIQKDSGPMPRAAVITAAGLTGILAGFRGGFLRKTFYSTFAMAGAASVCYPNQAKDLIRRGWRSARDLTNQTPGDKKPLPSSGSSKDSKSTLVPSTPIKKISEQVSAFKTETPKPTSSDKPSKPNTPPTAASSGSSSAKKDFGMSNPEDKDMYTTRDK